MLLFKTKKKQKKECKYIPKQRWFCENRRYECL